MTKADFVEMLANKLNVSKKVVEKNLHAISDALVQCIIDEKKFRFLDFGTFSIVAREARKGVNPRTGNKVDIPAKKVLKFKASKSLTEQIAKS